MKIKNTIILLIFAGVLFGFIALYERKQLSTTEEREQKARVIEFDRDEVDSIVIKNTETKIELRKDEQGTWRVVEPVKDRADSMAISQLFTLAESLRSGARIGGEKGKLEKEQLKEFGLTNSEMKLKFSGPRKTVELIFGKDAAVEGKVYVQLEDSQVAHVIGRELKELISRKADDFRDRRLTDLSTTQIVKLVVQTAAGEIQAAKTDQQWSLIKPLKARGDEAAINDLIAKAVSTRIEAFVAERATPGVFGLQEPRATVTLLGEGSESPTILKIGANPTDEKDKEKTYAMLSSREGVVLLPKVIEEILRATPNDLRDKHLVRLEADIVDRITLESSANEKIVLARSGESWVRKSGEMEQAINVAAARRVLDELRALQVSGFVADSGLELAKYGLDQPRVKVTFSSYASENTAETKAGERPVATVLFGRVEESIVYAKLEEEPFVVAVPATILDLLPTDPLQWQPLEIFSNTPDEIVGLEVGQEGQPAVSLERGADKLWKLAKGDGAVNQINAQSLTNTLARLRAVRWVGPSTPEHGLEKPKITVRFRNSDGTERRLLLGATTADEMTFASTDELRGTFAVSRPDVSAFQLPLLDRPAPSSTVVTPPPATPVPAPEPSAAPPITPPQ